MVFSQQNCAWNSLQFVLLNIWNVQTVEHTTNLAGGWCRFFTHVYIISFPAVIICGVWAFRKPDSQGEISTGREILSFPELEIFTVWGITKTFFWRTRALLITMRASYYHNSSECGHLFLLLQEVPLRQDEGNWRNVWTELCRWKHDAAVFDGPSSWRSFDNFVVKSWSELEFIGNPKAHWTTRKAQPRSPKIRRAFF